MATAINISYDEMHEHLSSQGFTQIHLEGVKELVYGKIVDKNLSLRIYTSIVADRSRGVGKDAIRVVLATKVNGTPKLIGVSKRVHRVEGWRRNLDNRINNWSDMVGPICPKCDNRMVYRESAHGGFWGCAAYPACRGVRAEWN